METLSFDSKYVIRREEMVEREKQMLVAEKRRLVKERKKKKARLQGSVVLFLTRLARHTHS